jgi:hypothetical protein
VAVPVSSFDEALLRGFLARLDQLEADRVLTPVITLDRLRESIDDGQRVLVEQVIGLRPGDYGVDTPYFKNVDGSPSDTDPGDFACTAEYAWLREHAVHFQFYESWPPGNEFGMRAEPWHWQYRHGILTAH